MTADPAQREVLARVRKLRTETWSSWLREQPQQFTRSSKPLIGTWSAYECIAHSLKQLRDVSTKPKGKKLFC